MAKCASRYRRHRGKPARYDVEYQRHGVRNLLLVCEPRRGWRDVTVTTTRNRIDFAHAMTQWCKRMPVPT